MEGRRHQPKPRQHVAREGQPEEDRRERKSRVAFAMVEFQILDEATARENQTGENSHERYKRRQHMLVLQRLSKGLVVPKKTQEED